MLTITNTWIVRRGHFLLQKSVLQQKPTKHNMTELPNNQHITYQQQYRKCGKTSCSTCRTSHGHGPYWYAYWREGTRLRSGYVGKVDPHTPQSVAVAMEGPERPAERLIDSKRAMPISA